MKQFIQHILVATIFLISFNHSVSSENNQRVYAVDLEAHLSAAGYKVGKFDGEWEKKDGTRMLYLKKALKKYVPKKKYGSENNCIIDKDAWLKDIKITAELFNAIRASLGDKAPPLKGKGEDSPYFIKGVLSNSWANPPPPSKKSVFEKLKARKTINPYKAWNYHRPVNGYGLYWESGLGNPRHKSIDNERENRVSLLSVEWHASMIKKPYPGIKKYLSKRYFVEMEHGKRLATKIIDPNFQDYIVNCMVSRMEQNQTDGIMFDWWHDDINRYNGYSKNQVRKARIAIAKKFRKRVGTNGILLGNVNWRKDKATVDYINGVFLELTKKSTKRVYSTSELKKIEGILNYYEKNLQPPKLVTLAGWRKTKDLTDEDRNTPENRKMAKLLTAMSVVINTNGYILYGDNNSDEKKGDYAHILYDFYSFDIGKPTSGYTKVKAGVGYKEHKQGFIAYNITNKSQKITRANGQKHQVEAKSGLFCKDAGSKAQCLSID